MVLELDRFEGHFRIQLVYETLGWPLKVDLVWGALLSPERQLLEREFKSLILWLSDRASHKALDFTPALFHDSANLLLEFGTLVLGMREVLFPVGVILRK